MSVKNPSHSEKKENRFKAVVIFFVSMFGEDFYCGTLKNLLREYTKDGIRVGFKTLEGNQTGLGQLLWKPRRGKAGREWKT